MGDRRRNFFFLTKSEIMPVIKIPLAEIQKELKESFCIKSLFLQTQEGKREREEKWRREGGKQRGEVEEKRSREKEEKRRRERKRRNKGER